VGGSSSEENVACMAVEKVTMTTEETGMRTTRPTRCRATVGRESMVAEIVGVRIEIINQIGRRTVGSAPLSDAASVVTTEMAVTATKRNTAWKSVTMAAGGIAQINATLMRVLRLYMTETGNAIAVIVEITREAVDLIADNGLLPPTVRTPRKRETRR